MLLEAGITWGKRKDGITSYTKAFDLKMDS